MSLIQLVKLKKADVSHHLYVKVHDDTLLVGQVRDAVGESHDEGRLHLAPDDVGDANWKIVLRD